MEFLDLVIVFPEDKKLIQYLKIWTYSFLSNLLESVDWWKFWKKLHWNWSSYLFMKTHRVLIKDQSTQFEFSIEDSNFPWPNSDEFLSFLEFVSNLLKEFPEIQSIVGAYEITDYIIYSQDDGKVIPEHFPIVFFPKWARTSMTGLTEYKDIKYRIDETIQHIFMRSY